MCFTVPSGRRDGSPRRHAEPTSSHLMIYAAVLNLEAANVHFHSPVRLRASVHLVQRSLLM